MATVHLTDSQWVFIQPLLPPPARTGRPRADVRCTVEGILYVLITGCRWQDLPREYGAPTTVWRRLKRWGEAGIWERIWRAALAILDAHGKLDWSMAFLDGSFVPAKKGGEHAGLTRKGKGTKWMLVVDGNGLPLGLHLDSASRAEVRLAQQTLDTIRVARPHGRPKQRPEKLVADRGYDSSAFRQALRRRGIRMCIPPKRRPARWKAKRGRPVVARMHDYRQRYTVEIVHPQMTKPNGGTVAGGGEDIADLDIAVGDNDTVDQEFDKRPPLLKSRRAQAIADLGAKCLKRLRHGAQRDVLLGHGLELPLLTLQRLLSAGQFVALAVKHRQGEHASQISIE
jgi:transposase